MLFSSEKYAKYICLIAIVLMHLALPTAAVIQCIQCGGFLEQCSIILGETAKDCANDQYTKCFTQIDTAGTINRGCKTEDEANTCIAQNNCVITDSGKNNQLICKKCLADNVKCSQTDMNVNDLKYNQICDEDIRKCITKVDKLNKHVVRGCATDAEIDQCTDYNTCATCTDVTCNTGIFPTKRIHCYQCTGSSCVDVVRNNIVSKPCVNYVDNDQCYTFAKTEADMTRGCQSDVTDNQCNTTAPGCTFCSKDNCNNLKYKHDQKLKCHQCSSDDPKNDCFKTQTGTPRSCEQQILYNVSEYCYTQVNNVGKIQRGCLHDNTDLTVDNCKDSDIDTCNKCNTNNGCNSKAVSVKFTCIVCRSDIDEKCWDHADTMTGKGCRVSPSSAKEGCFHGIWHGDAIRGCMVDASIQNQYICRDTGNHQCNACYSNNCNNKKSSTIK